MGRPTIIDMLNAHAGADDASHDALSLLSPREREVLGMTSQGLTNREVAAQLEVSVHAVKFHLASSYRKLGVANRTEAAVAYLRGQLGVASTEH